MRSDPANPILIVGGGLSGLACARRLETAGARWRLLEAGDRVGGKVRTDVVQGYRLDRGFQVYFESYPAAQSLTRELSLRPFARGALVFHEGRLWTVDERRPVTTALSPLFGLGDKLRTLALRRGGDEREDETAIQYLRRRGFSDRWLDRFARPFLGGIFLDRSLGVSARQFRFVWDHLARSGASVPALGMGRIAESIADPLPSYRISLYSPVRTVAPGGVTLRSGEQVAGSAVVLATPGPETARLLGEPTPEYKASVCLWYAAPVRPYEGGYLVLDGEGTGPVNHVACLTNVAPGYGPTPLVSAIVLGSTIPEDEAVRAQMARWFPNRETDRWRLLRTDSIQDAQLPQTPGFRPATVETSLPGVLRAGADSSIEGAVRGGLRAAEAALAAYFPR